MVVQKHGRRAIWMARTHKMHWACYLLQRLQRGRVVRKSPEYGGRLAEIRAARKARS